MSKKRVHEIAKQQGLTSKEVLAALNAAGIEAKVAASSVEEEDALKVLAAAGSGDGAAAASKAKPAAKKPKPAAKKPKPAAEKAADGKPTDKGPARAAGPVRRSGGEA